jgi:hypothetical protein
MQFCDFLSSQSCFMLMHKMSFTFFSTRTRNHSRTGSIYFLMSHTPFGSSMTIIELEGLKKLRVAVAMFNPLIIVSNLNKFISMTKFQSFDSHLISFQFFVVVTESLSPNKFIRFDGKLLIF